MSTQTNTQHRTSLLGVALLLALGGVAVWGLVNLGNATPVPKAAVAQTVGGEALSAAIKSGDAGRIKAAIDGGADVNIVLASDQGGRTGMTPLIHACFESPPAVVKTLLSASAKTEARTADGRTALMYAAGWGDAQKVKLLLEAGARPDARANDGWTALMWAAARGDAASVQALVESGADVNAVTKWRQSALMHAARTGSMPKVAKLLEVGASAALVDTNGDSALTIAAASDAPAEVVEALVAAGCSVNHADQDGVTALMKAAERADAAQIGVLLKLGADRTLKDKANTWTAKDWAAKRDDEAGRAAVKLLSDK